VLTGGGDAATLIAYDNATAASGTILFKLAVAAGASTQFTPCAAMFTKNGIYAALTGTAPSATVLFTP
jgi:hypothetical protein